MAKISDKVFQTSSYKLPYFITPDNLSINYNKYISSVLTKTDKKNEPTKLEFSLTPVDKNFIKLKRGNYIVIQTAKYNNWFTGFVINDPELTYIGTDKGKGVWGYKYTAVSDEVLINLKPLGLRAPLMNLTQGEILSKLAEDLCPGMYDTSNIQDGLLIPRYQIVPTNKFSDVVKEFTDASKYIFYGNAGKLYFAPADSSDFPVVIDGNDRNFTPNQLTLTPTSDPIVNDATVIGDVEPQTYVSEYFAGDGFTGAYTLTSSPYGVDSTLLLQDTFTGATIDSAKWTLYDTQDQYVTIKDGYVNIEGGPATTNALSDNRVHLDSAYPLPFEGKLRITHGEWDFIPHAPNSINIQGLICGLWKDTPSANNLSNIVYGLGVSAQDSAGAFVTLFPVLSGSGVVGKDIKISTANRYVIRTNYTFGKRYRTVHALNYISESGDFTNVGGQSTSDTVTIETIISEINVDTGVLQNQYFITDYLSVDSSLPAYLMYVPYVSYDLHATFTNITISVPLQASLYEAPPVSTDATGYTTPSLFNTLKFPKVTNFITRLMGPNELDSLDGQAPFATIVDDGSGAVTKSSLLGSPKYNEGTAALTYFKDSVRLESTTPVQSSLICLKYREAGSSVGRVKDTSAINSEAVTWGDDGIRALVKNDASPKPRTSQECEVVAAAIVGDGNHQHYEGTYKFCSDFLTHNYQPLSGTIINFANLPAIFPNLQAEEATQVVTTLDSDRPERFTHTVNFGNIDRVAQLLAKYNKPTDIFAPTDAVEAPISVEVEDAGEYGVPEVLSFTYDGMDTTHYYYRISENPPVGGGFEVRYSNDSWGSSSGKNLITRIPFDSTKNGQYTFSVPRSSRSKIVFVRPYNLVNLLPFSEDLTNWSNEACSLTNTTVLDPDGNYSTITNVNVTAGTSSNEYGLYSGKYGYGVNKYGYGGYGEQEVTISSSGVYTFSIYINAENSKKLELRIIDKSLPDGSQTIATNVVTATGIWKKYSTTVTITNLNAKLRVGVFGYTHINQGFAQEFYATRATLEHNATDSSVYVPTIGFQYGNMSRYSSAVRVNLPLVPPPVAAVTVATSGVLDDINTITTGSGNTSVTTTITQVDSSGTVTQNNPTIANPQITIRLPDLLLDVFGIEIRDNDNTTVLYRQPLTSAGFSLAVSLVNSNVNRNIHYHVYTYNVFGEYSSDAFAQARVYTPTVKNVQISTKLKRLLWAGVASTQFVVNISDDASVTQNVRTIIIPTTYNPTVYAPFYLDLADDVFIPLKYYTITPQDEFGNGKPVQISHQYNASDSAFHRPSTYLLRNNSNATVSSPEASYDTDNNSSGVFSITTNQSSNNQQLDITFNGFEDVTTTEDKYYGIDLGASINVNDNGGAGVYAAATVIASYKSDAYSQVGNPNLNNLIPVQGGGYIYITCGLVNNGTAITLPSGFSADYMLSWVTVGRAYNQGDTIVHGVKSAGFTGLAPSSAMQDGGSNAPFGQTSNYIIVAWTSSANVTLNTRADGTKSLIFTTANGDKMAVAAGQLTNGATLTAPSGFNNYNMIPMIGMAGMTDQGKQIHGFGECTIDNSGVINATYVNENAQVSNVAIANVIAFYYLPQSGIYLKSITNGTAMIIPTLFGRSAVLSVGRVSNGASIGSMPFQTFLNGCAAMATMNSGQANHRCHGITACQYSGTYTGTYADGDGNTWTGNGNVFTISSGLMYNSTGQVPLNTYNQTDIVPQFPSYNLTTPFHYITSGSNYDRTLYTGFIPAGTNLSSMELRLFLVGQIPYSNGQNQTVSLTVNIYDIYIQ